MNLSNNTREMRHGEEDDVVVIGGGIANLTTAIYLAHAGRFVTVLEQSSEVGGPARTSIIDGYYFTQSLSFGSRRKDFTEDRNQVQW